MTVNPTPPVADNSAFGGPNATQAANANAAITPPPAVDPNTPGSPTYNPNGFANAPATPAASGTPSPYYNRYTPGEQQASDYLDTFQAPQSESDIQAAKTQAAQGQINSLNQYYDTLRREQDTINAGRSRGTNSVSTLTGLSGSTEANVAADTTTKLNQNDTDKIEAERNDALQSIFTNIASSAAQEAQQSRLEARQSANDVLAQRTARATDATNQLTALAKSSSGATLDGLKANLPADQYNYLINNAGGEANAAAILFANRPKNTVLGQPQVVGGKMVQAYQTPDGKVVYENIALPDGVTPDNIQSIEKTDNGLFIINKDGTYKMVAGSADTLANQLKAAQIREANANADKTIAANNNANSDPKASELKSTALTSAQNLLTMFNSGQGTSAVGGDPINRLGPVGDWLGKGTGRADFLTQYNNLKALLSLDNVKYLKGQGAISDSERALLEKASATLSRDQSEEAFKSSLSDTITALCGGVNGSGGNTSSQPSQINYNGTLYNVDANGDMTPAQ